MIELRATIPDNLVEPLEEHFCGEVRSPWMILHPRPEDEVSLSGFFRDANAGRDAWEELLGDFPTLPAVPEPREVPDTEWKEAYKHHLRPWREGNLRWLPEWERNAHEVRRGEAVLYLDSGLAFGTGSHETTRLCARALVRYDEALERPRDTVHVIDAGCGSGILALSAASLGFTHVYGFDNDPEAVHVSRENARANHLGERIEWAEAGIERGLADRRADLLMANIQSDILKIYADEFATALAPGATLALSGILHHEAEAVRDRFAAALAAQGLRPEASIENEGEWSLVLFQ